MILRFTFLTLFAAGLLGCSSDDGPAETGGTGGTGTGSTSGSTNATTGGSGAATSTSTDSAGSTSGSTASTGPGSTGTGTTGGGSTSGGSCVGTEQNFSAGCGTPPSGGATVEDGCYEPCDENTPCARGNCVSAWVNPCVEDPCAACGGEQLLCLPGGATGAACGADNECASGVCWDFSDYDPFCFGTTCSGLCETKQDCVAMATAANAPTPDGALCGADGRCDLVSAGLGAFGCAASRPITERYQNIGQVRSPATRLHGHP